MPKDKAKPKVKPVHEVRLGRIKAAVWRNETDNGAMFNVTLSRLYKPEGENWCDSTSFGRDDLLLLRKVIDMAHTWVCQQTQDQNGNHKSEQNGSSQEESEVHF